MTDKPEAASEIAEIRAWVEMIEADPHDFTAQDRIVAARMRKLFSALSAKAAEVERLRAIAEAARSVVKETRESFKACATIHTGEMAYAIDELRARLAEYRALEQSNDR